MGQPPGLRPPRFRLPRFDFDRYLDWLASKNHIFIRLWRWEFVKSESKEVTVWAPHPWARTGPGTALDGLPKFDLSRFDDEYFGRLRSRVKAARDRGIYVGVMLFEGYGFHSTKWPWRWTGNPFHRDNNINGVDGDANGDDYGIELQIALFPRITPGLMAAREAQARYVEKVIDTLNDLDNVLYEIVNESGAYSTEWQYEMIRFVKQYEAKKPKQHPVGMTFQYSNMGRGTNANLFASPADWISPSNQDPYRDDPPPATGAKVILSDTDHLWGEGGDGVWVWKSFTRGLNPIFMDGGIRTFPASADWRESARDAMGDALAFARRVNLTSMTPRGELSSTKYCLANAGVEYLVYQPATGPFSVELPPGAYSVEWFNPRSRSGSKGPPVQATAGRPESFTPPFEGQAVLYLKANLPR